MSGDKKQFHWTLWLDPINVKIVLVVIWMDLEPILLRMMCKYLEIFVCPICSKRAQLLYQHWKIKQENEIKKT